MAVRNLTHDQFKGDQGYAIMREKGEFIDAKLCSYQSTSQLILGHRAVLASVSSILKQKFKRSPDIEKPISLKTVSHHNLSQVVEFIYKGEITIPQDSFDEFCATYMLLNIKLGHEIDKKFADMESDDEETCADTPIVAETSQHESVEAKQGVKTGQGAKIEQNNKQDLEKMGKPEKSVKYDCEKSDCDKYNHQKCEHAKYDHDKCGLMNPQIGWPSSTFTRAPAPPSPIPDSVFQVPINEKITGNPLLFAGIIIKKNVKLADYKKDEYEEDDADAIEMKLQINNETVSSSTHEPLIKGELSDVENSLKPSDISPEKIMKQEFEMECTEPSSSGPIKKENKSIEKNPEPNQSNTNKKETTDSIDKGQASNGLEELGYGLLKTMSITTAGVIDILKKDSVSSVGNAMKKGPGGFYWILMQNITDAKKEDAVRDTFKRFGTIVDFLRNPEFPHIVYVAFNNEQEATESVRMLKLCQKGIGATCVNVIKLHSSFDSKYPPLTNSNDMTYVDTSVPPPVTVMTQGLRSQSISQKNSGKVFNPQPITIPTQMNMPPAVLTQPPPQLPSKIVPSQMERPPPSQIRHDNRVTPDQVKSAKVKVYIGNLPNEGTDRKSLKEMFENHHAPFIPSYMSIQHNPNSIPVKCFAFVYCKNLNDASIFVKALNGKIYRNRKIVVKHLRNGSFPRRNPNISMDNEEFSRARNLDEKILGNDRFPNLKNSMGNDRFLSSRNSMEIDRFPSPAMTHSVGNDEFPSTGNSVGNKIFLSPKRRRTEENDGLQSPSRRVTRINPGGQNFQSLRKERRSRGREELEEAQAGSRGFQAFEETQAGFRDLQAVTGVDTVQGQRTPVMEDEADSTSSIGFSE